MSETEYVLVRREGEDPITCTKRAFETLYRDKGFELVNRGNASAASKKTEPPKRFPERNVGGTSQGRIGGTPEGQKPGSASQVAANLGIKTGNENPGNAS